MAKNKVIPRRYVDNYSDVLDALSTQAMNETAAALAKVNLADIDTARQVLIDLMQAICGAYTDSAAAVAARFYEVCRNYVLGGQYEALTESGRIPDATRVAVLGIVDKYAENGNLDSFYTQMLERVDFEIKRAAADCTFANMGADPYRGE